MYIKKIKKGANYFMILLTMYIVINIVITVFYSTLAVIVQDEDNPTCFGFLLPIYYCILQNKLNLNLAGLIILLIVITILTLPAILFCFMVTLLAGVAMMIWTGFITLLQKNK